MKVEERWKEDLRWLRGKLDEHSHVLFQIQHCISVSFVAIKIELFRKQTPTQYKRPLSNPFFLYMAASAASASHNSQRLRMKTIETIQTQQIEIKHVVERN